VNKSDFCEYPVIAHYFFD